MSRLRAAAARLAGFLRRRGADADLRDEMAFHLEMMAQQLRRQGLDEASARREARARFGGSAQIEEAYRDQRSLPWAETLVQDLRYGVRTLARSPGVTVVALLTLALGIGANTAIFSIVNTVVLRPLPYVTPERLVVFGDSGMEAGEPAIGTIGYTTFDDLRRATRTFDAMAAVRSWVPTLAAGGEAERLAGMRVSWNYFAMLGVEPAIGSGFTPEQDRPGQWQVVLLSDGLWRRRFGADPAVVGRSITMNDLTFRIAGVMPAGFEPVVSARYYKPAELWAPLGYDTTLGYACRSCQHLRALGRIAPGRSAGEAGAELAALRQQLAAEHPGDYDQSEMSISLLQDEVAGPVRPVLFVLLGAAGFVLLIACANVANLLLARATVRSHEMALRSALGAGRARLVRQLLTEALVLGAAGGALGVGLAWLSFHWLAGLAPVSIPRMEQLSLDGRVLAFALLVSLATALIFGLIPALRASSAGVQSAAGADPRITAGRVSGRARQLLIVADLALALVLLAGSGLMLKSVSRLLQIDPGFSADRVLTLQLSLVGTAYREDAAVLSFIERAIEHVQALPGVEAAAMAGQVPLGGSRDSWGFHIEGRVPANPAEDPNVERYSVTPDYFRVLGIPLRRGRLITDEDRPGSLPVIVLGESTARALWPGQDPIGQRVRIGSATSGPWRTVVGVAGDVRHADLAATPTLQMYLPQAQVTDSFLVLAVRSATADAGALPSQVRGVIRSLDPAVPIYDVATMAALVGRAVAERRFVMQLLGAFAALALLLAGVGLYGVVSYAVAQRTRELGLRVALGARPADILRLVLGSGAGTIAAGLAAGLTGAFVTSRFLEAQLFEVRAGDPWTLGAAMLALAAVAAVAHILPARRALRVDPVIALRQE
jgi:putative ABC transport system permease protein